MSIVVTARHARIPKGQQEYVEQKAEEIRADFSRVEHVHVIIDKEKRFWVVEVVVQAKNHVHAEGKESSENLRNAIDEAFDKVERRLRRERDKVQDHRAQKPPAPAVPEEEVL